MGEEFKRPIVQFVSVQGVRVAYSEVNSTGTSVLLLFHGLAESHRFFWDPIFNPSQNKYRIIAFDLLGHGETTSAKSYSPYFQAELIYTIIESLNIDLVSILAHSLGGMVGMAFVLQYPELVDKLIMYSTPISRGLIRTILELLKEVSVFSLLPGFPLLFPFSGRIMKLFPSIMQKQIFRLIFWQWNMPYDLNAMRDGFQGDMIDEAVRTSGVGLEKTVRQTFLLPRMFHRLREISHPVLFIKGSQDFILSDKMAEKYVHEMLDARLVILSNTSHISLLDNPYEFIEAVAEFLST